MSSNLLQVEDLFHLEQIGRYYGGAYSFSPDGKTLAYVLQRAKATTKNHKQDFLYGNDRADIWLVDLATSKTVNITKGKEEDVGYWSPAWSPDGKRLGMLSTKGENVTLWVWNKATGDLQQLTHRGINFENVRDRPYVWISDEEIICTVLPENEKPLGMIIETDAPQKAWQGSLAANRGEEVTVSVLQSGVAVDVAKGDQKTSIVVNVVKNTTKTLVTANTQEYTLSPNKDWLACLETVDIRQPQADLPLNFELAFRYAVKLVSLQNLEQKRLEVSNDVLGGSLCWSPDSDRLAFIGYESKRSNPPRIYIYNCKDDTVQTWGGTKLNAAPLIRNKPRLLWTVDNKLLVYAAQTEKVQPSPQDRYDWWLVASDGEESCLTADMKTPPVELLAEVGSKTFIGLAEGNLWRVKSDRTLENITTELEASITAIVYPGDTRRGDTQVVSTRQEFTKIIVSAEVEEQTKFYQIDLVEDTWKLLEKPAAKAQVAAYETQTDTVIFTAKDDTGTYLWSCCNQNNCFLETNTFLREIKPGQLRQIEYTSLDGEELKAQLILPPDYDSERTYPVILDVYPGWVISPTPHPSHELNFLSPLNFQLAAARGYVFLQPSIPLKPEGEADDPMLKLLNGVLPAVEKAIALGIADPERLYLMGQSFGGYAVYGLITQTHRFKAAVSLAGLANLVSIYGAFDPRFRYWKNAHESFFLGALLESGQTSMGNPPWKDLGRYLRNSPIFAVDRVETPLMIIQGDIDYVPIQQGEEFFSSLYRQGKRAEFVRYWGEGHVLSSPANIKDMWQRIFAWFEEF